jgi:lipoyl(octanoyl) transferase
MKTPLENAFNTDTSYCTIWQQQKECLHACIAGDIKYALLLGEHPLIYTLGRGFHQENLLLDTLPTLAIERGGDITLHNPGQLVAYPIFTLAPPYRNLHQVLRDLEQEIIQILDMWEIQGTRQPEKTGVWVKGKKIAAIGLAVKHWTLYHGISLNICNDLKDYLPIHPCGFPAAQVTSMQEQRPDVDFWAAFVIIQTQLQIALSAFIQQRVFS